jgi:TonB-dependent receptor
VGWAGRAQTRDLQNFTRNYTYNGVNGDLSATKFRAVVYGNIKEPLITGIERNPPPGKGVPYSSPHLAFQAYQKDASLFSTTPAQAVSMESGRRSNSLYFDEGVDALYVQGEVRLFRNRLNLLGGVRYERTTNLGLGLLNDPNAVWARNPDGSFVRNAAGQRIRRPEAGATGSLEQLNLTHVERGYRANRSYDGYYPSIHLTYNVRENLLARLAYAATYGRPNYAEIVPNTVINEADLGAEPDPNAVRGTLTVRNTGLRPWTADNFDLSLEYYTDSGGLFGAGVFHKEIKEFFGTFARVATAADIATLGLDPAYAGWQVNTAINTGNARVSGYELSANQSLQPLGAWGRPFKIFANYTRIEVKGDNEADFSGFLPEVLNYGLTFSMRGFIVMAKWHRRADVEQGLQSYLGPDARAYVKGRTLLDLNVSYQLHRRTSLFLNIRNALNERVDYLRYGSQTPLYAQMYQARDYGGATIDLGIKGTF